MQLGIGQGGTAAAPPPQLSRARTPRAVATRWAVNPASSMQIGNARKQLIDPLTGKAKIPLKKAKKKRGSKLEYKRVDQLWDSTIHNYKLTDTAEDVESSEYDQYRKLKVFEFWLFANFLTLVFNIRRTFDWVSYSLSLETYEQNA